MKTISVLIGNSDNKLSQSDWAHFYNDVRELIEEMTKCVHFVGTSHCASLYQNACFVLEIGDESIERLNDSLSSIASIYDQDSIAVVIGDTFFIS